MAGTNESAVDRRTAMMPTAMATKTGSQCSKLPATNWITAATSQHTDDDADDA
jgi:hypothetical protein